MSKYLKILAWLAVAIGVIAGYHYLLAPWLDKRVAADRAYEASHHDVCTDAQKIIQVSPNAGGYGRTNGFNVWGDRGGYKFSGGYPAPGIGADFCFGVYVSTPNE